MLYKLIEEVFEGIDRENSVRIDSIEFAPVFLRKKDFEYLLLQEALNTRRFFVKESGRVSELIVINELEVPVLIIEGEELVGGLQNRIVNKSILVKESSKVEIPVSCVERGRWHYYRPMRSRMDDFSEPEVEDEESIQFLRHSSRVIDSEVRAAKIMSMIATSKNSKTIKADQDVVWRMVDRSLKKAGAHSSTSAAYEAYLKKKEELERIKEKIKPVDGQSGFAVFVYGELYGIEYVHMPEKFEKYFGYIIDSYLIDLVGAKPLLKRKKTKKTMLGRPEKFVIEKSVSLGENIYASWNGYVGHGLVYRDNLMHLSIISANDVYDEPIGPLY